MCLLDFSGPGLPDIDRLLREGRPLPPTLSVDLPLLTPLCSDCAHHCRRCEVEPSSRGAAHVRPSGRKSKVCCWLRSRSRSVGAGADRERVLARARSQAAAACKVSSACSAVNFSPSKSARYSLGGEGAVQKETPSEREREKGEERREKRDE